MTVSVLFLCLFVNGVFGVDADEVKSVSGMEGQNVTLYTDATDIQTADRIVWVFVSESTRIAQHNIASRKISLYEDVLDGKFRERLMLDRHTGSLTITNIRTTDSGLYELQIVKGTDIISRSFSIIFSAHLPIPQITSDCPHNTSSVSKCALSCSVMNVSHVSLSWYKGKSLLSSISVSDLNIRLSLPLEVEYQDTNTYRCVINNTITNQTQHLHINDVCRPCSGVFGDTVSVNDGWSVTLHTGLTDIQRVELIVWWFNGHRIAKINRAVNSDPAYDPDERFTDRLKMNPQTGDLTITDITSELTGKYKLEIDGESIITKSFIVSLSSKLKIVIERDSVTLHIDVTEEQRNEKIHWKIKHNNSPVAEIITENGKISTPFIEERFRDRLKLDDQTGDLIITHMKNEDSGQYEADVTIGSNTHTIHKTFSFTGSGPSSGLITAVCVSLLLLVIAGAVVGVICHHRKKRRQDSNTGEESL